MQNQTWKTCKYFIWFSVLLTNDPLKLGMRNVVWGLETNLCNILKYYLYTIITNVTI
jgi:hypothetical protein